MSMKSIVSWEKAPFDKCVCVCDVSGCFHNVIDFVYPNSPPLSAVNHLLWKGYIHVSMKSILGRKKCTVWQRDWFCSPNSLLLFTVNHLLWKAYMSLWNYSLKRKGTVWQVCVGVCTTWLILACHVGWVLPGNRRLINIRYGSPGRPPRLSHSSWALACLSVGVRDFVGLWFLVFSFLCNGGQCGPMEKWQIMLVVITTTDFCKALFSDTS